jgi:hypothetical protein
LLFLSETKLTIFDFLSTCTVFSLVRDRSIKDFSALTIDGWKGFKRVRNSGGGGDGVVVIAAVVVVVVIIMKGGGSIGSVMKALQSAVQSVEVSEVFNLQFSMSLPPTYAANQLPREQGAFLPNRLRSYWPHS